MLGRVGLLSWRGVLAGLLLGMWVSVATDFKGSEGSNAGAGSLLGGGLYAHEVGGKHPHVHGGMDYENMIVMKDGDDNDTRHNGERGDNIAEDADHHGANDNDDDNDNSVSDHGEDVPKHKSAQEIEAGHELELKSQHAQGPQAVIKKELEQVGIEEKVGAVLDGDIAFTNRLGERIEIARLLAEKKPILLSFFYATCPSLCQYVLNAKAETLAKLGLKLGEDYLAVSVSFDSRDTPELMEVSYRKYMALYDGMAGQYRKSDISEVAATADSVAVAPSSAERFDEYVRAERWLFLRGTEAAVQKLTLQLGFLFKRLTGEGEEFAHTAAMYVITPNGKISRYFYGLLYPPFDVKMAVLEAKQEKERSTLDRILLYCYRYDAEEKGYVLYAQNIMKAGGVAIIVFLAILIGTLLKLEKRRQRSSSESEVKAN